MKSHPVPYLPLTIGDITTDVLTDMLRSRFPGTVVTTLRVAAVIPGTCTKLRLELTYNAAGDAHGLPATMCLKGNFESHGLAGQVYPREVWFYQHVASLIGGSLPRCYFAGRNDRQAVILMEDLLARSARFGRASDLATVEQVSSLLCVLAAVHGRFWDGYQLDGLGGEPHRTSGCAVLDFSDQVLYQPAIFEGMMQQPRAAVVPAELRDLNVARHYLGRLIHHFDAGPRCLVHGDAHLGNTYYLQDGAGAGFIDWQTYAPGHWAFDVSYLLCTGLESATRRRHEKGLIDLYLSELERNGGTSPGTEAAWLAYRRMAFYGFAWTLCPPELQAEEVCGTCAARVAVAITELGTLEALDAPEIPEP